MKQVNPFFAAQSTAANTLQNDAKAQAKVDEYRTKLALCLGITLVILLISPFVFNCFGLEIKHWQWIGPLLEGLLFSVIYFYGSLPFYQQFIVLFKSSNHPRLVQLINIIDAAIYLYGVIAAIEASDGIMMLGIITFIDAMLLVNLIILKLKV